MNLRQNLFSRLFIIYYLTRKFRTLERVSKLKMVLNNNVLIILH